jgi:hypothetical protein
MTNFTFVFVLSAVKPGYLPLLLQRSHLLGLFSDAFIAGLHSQSCHPVVMRSGRQKALHIILSRCVRDPVRSRVLKTEGEVGRGFLVLARGQKRSHLLNGRHNFILIKCN